MQTELAVPALYKHYRGKCGRKKQRNKEKNVRETVCCKRMHHNESQQYSPPHSHHDKHLAQRAAQTEHGHCRGSAPRFAAACSGNNQQHGPHAPALCSFAVTFRTHGHYPVLFCHYFIWGICIIECKLAFGREEIMCLAKAVSGWLVSYAIRWTVISNSQY